MQPWFYSYTLLHKGHFITRPTCHNYVESLRLLIRIHSCMLIQIWTSICPCPDYSCTYWNWCFNCFYNSRIRTYWGSVEYPGNPNTCTVLKYIDFTWSNIFDFNIKFLSISAKFSWNFYQIAWKQYGHIQKFRTALKKPWPWKTESWIPYFSRYSIYCVRTLWLLIHMLIFSIRPYRTYLGALKYARIQFFYTCIWFFL